MSSENLNISDSRLWFALRDLKRPNAKTMAWQELSERGFEVFTPMTQVVRETGGKRRRIEIPAVPDLLFVHSTRERLDPVVASIPTLQYRFVKGAPAGTAMTVDDSSMDRFVRAVSGSADTRYFNAGEITPSMIGREVRVIGGPLDGFTGNLLSVRGLRSRRLIVDLHGFLSAAVEVAPEFIQIIPT